MIKITVSTTPQGYTGIGAVLKIFAYRSHMNGLKQATKNYEHRRLYPETVQCQKVKKKCPILNRYPAICKIPHAKPGCFAV